MKVPIWVCVGVGILCGALGFFGGVATSEIGRDFFAELSRVESPADVENPRKLKTDFYELKYPGNWNLDEDDSDFDVENYFLIESAGSNFVLFAFEHYESDLDEGLEFYVEEYEGMMRNPKITEFTRYGDLEGKGKRIEGKVYGNKTMVDIFCGAANGITVSVVEWIYLDEEKDVLPGFELIESSFVLTEEGESKKPSKPKSAEAVESEFGDEARSE